MIIFDRFSGDMSIVEYTGEIEPIIFSDNFS